MRAGNVVGGGDWSENRLIPDLFRAYLSDNSLLVRNPNSTRPWQHVLDPLYGYLLVSILPELPSFPHWNFGPHPDDCIPVHSILDLIRRSYPINYTFSQSPTSLKEAPTLVLSSDRAFADLNWKPHISISDVFESTAQWYVESSRTARISLVNKQILQFLSHDS